MSKKLTRTEALRVSHEVACWVIYEIVMGGMVITQRMRERQIVGWYIHANEHDLGGWCWFASTATVRVLKARGHEATVAARPDDGAHGFVVTACGIKIDPTAMQFGRDAPTVQRMRKGELFRSVPSRSENWRSHITSPRSQYRAMRRILRRMGA